MSIGIIEVIIYVLSGGLISLATLLVNWKIEERKRRFLWRKEFINKCKGIVDEYKFNPDGFRETSYYSNLKPYLSNKLQKEIDKKRHLPRNSKEAEERTMRGYAIKKKLLDEIAVLEQKWGLL